MLRAESILGYPCPELVLGIINAMLTADSMTGADNVRVHGLPHGRLVEVLKKQGRVLQ